MNMHTRNLIEAARAVVRDIDDCIPGNDALKKRLTAALKPFDRAEEPKLAWTRNGADGLTARVGDHVYAVAANDNEPEHSSIRWWAMVDGRPLSDGEPRQSDAKLLCYRHAQREANVREAFKPTTGAKS
jgi:hypothetical protein